MRKNLLYLSLIIGVFNLFLFWTDFCFALQAPKLLSPDDGAIDVSLSPILDWESVSGAESYEIRTAQTDDPCDAIAEAAWTEWSEHPTQSEYQLFGLSPATRYCWKIKAESETVESDWSEKWAFTTQELAPPSPVCGNGICEAGEDANNCPEDCAPGNGGPGGPGGPGSGGPGWRGLLLNPLRAETLEEAIDALLNFLLLLALALAPLLIIYAAFLIMTAAGDAKQITKGKTIIMWTLVALVIILLAKGLPSIIRGAFGG